MDKLFTKRLYAILSFLLLTYVGFKQFETKNIQPSRAARETSIFSGTDNVDEHFEHSPEGDDINDKLGLKDILDIDADSWEKMVDDVEGTDAEFPYDNSNLVSEHNGVGTDDVASFAKGKTNKKKPAKGSVSLTQIKFKDIEALHSKIIQVHQSRIKQIALVSHIIGDDMSMAVDKPFETLTPAEKEFMAIPYDATDYPDRSNTADLHPTVESLLADHGYSETNVFKEGSTQFIAMFPATIALNTDADKHVSDYQHYFKFIELFQTAFNHWGGGRIPIRLTLGLYHRGVVFQPANVPYKPQRFPWSRTSFTYLRPKASVEQPRIVPSIKGLQNVVKKYGGRDSGTGKDCFTLWFHHDISIDFAQLNLEENAEKMAEINSMCNIIHIFVGFKDNRASMEQYAVLLNPHLRTYKSVDSKMNGVYFLDSYADLNSDFKDLLLKYIHLTRTRQTCRLRYAGYSPPEVKDDLVKLDATTEAPMEGTTGAPEEEELATTESATTETTVVNGVVVAETTVPPEEAALDQLSLADPVAPYHSVINACCGADMWTGVAYDNVVKSCCDDGSVKSWLAGDMDPCIDFGNK